MIDDIASVLNVFPNALWAGFIISIVCPLLGVFTILKRVVFVGIALSEVAACGIAAAMLLNFQPYAGAAICSLGAVIVLSLPLETSRLPRDAVLGILFVFASSLSVLLVSKSGFGLHEVKALLYGDLILTDRRDLYVIVATLAPVLAYILLFFRPTLYTFLDREVSKLLGVKVKLYEFLFFFCLGLAVSAASKVAGALLIFCHLVVAPSAAFLLSRRMAPVFFLAVLGSLISTAVGIYWSFVWDLPANQMIALCCSFWFGIAALAHGKLSR